LIVVLSLSTIIIILANLLQPRIALQVRTSPRMFITAIRLGTSPDIVNLGNLREMDMEQLHRVLDSLQIVIKAGELRVLERVETTEDGELAMLMQSHGPLQTSPTIDSIGMK
jgi:hypothetical protein